MQLPSKAVDKLIAASKTHKQVASENVHAYLFIEIFTNDGALFKPGQFIT